MSERHVAAILQEGGFSESQIEALTSVFAVLHHSHQIDEINGLVDQLDEIGEAVDLGPSEPDDEE